MSLAQRHCANCTLQTDNVYPPGQETTVRVLDINSNKKEKNLLAISHGVEVFAVYGVEEKLKQVVMKSSISACRYITVYVIARKTNCKNTVSVIQMARINEVHFTKIICETDILYNFVTGNYLEIGDDKNYASIPKTVWNNCNSTPPRLVVHENSFPCQHI